MTTESVRLTRHTLHYLLCVLESESRGQSNQCVTMTVLPKASQDVKILVALVQLGIDDSIFVCLYE